MPASTTVTITYLQMTSPAQLRASGFWPVDGRVARVDPPVPELNRFFYEAVGREWCWIDRLAWTPLEWHNYAHAQGVETWILTQAGIPAGYYELDSRSGDPQIAYFGLLKEFIGQGLGGYLLTHAIHRAWEIGGNRVWVHTCTLDHPAALAAYQARGFEIYQTETVEIELPTE
ncbi:MAG: GNAT family N-acetyltransferase [Planctomyces sp.]|nr:GNAT family N-acetyltransferase [Planctomyces sp.]